MEISTVQLDIARFAWEVGKRKSDKELAEWVNSLVDSLVLRDKTINNFGAFLLGEVENWREKERIRKEKARKSKDSKDSKDSK